MPEPSSFCIAIMPAFFIAISSILMNNFKFIGIGKCFIIVLAFLLSFSTLGYVGIFISMLVILFNNNLKLKFRIVYSIALFLTVLLVYNNIADFKLRIRDTTNVLLGRAKIETVNRSTSTLFTNALVTYNIFKHNFIFGYGLGSHELAYDKYINQSLYNADCWRMHLNKKDANSLFLRILSEAGIFGLLAFLCFIIKFYISRKKDTVGYLWLINNAILVFFMIRLIRQGNYFSEGFFFFFWLYYFSKKTFLNKFSHEDSY